MITLWTGLFLLLLILDATAQENLPACVSTCMEDIAVGIGCVSSENLPCTCRTPGFVDNVLQCFSASCTDQTDQQRGSDEVRGQCIAYTSAVVTPSETSSSASATGTSSTVTFTPTTIVTITSSGPGPSGTTPSTTPTVPPHSSSQSAVGTGTSTRGPSQPSGSPTSGSTKMDVDWQIGYLWTVLVGIGLGALLI